MRRYVIACLPILILLTVTVFLRSSGSQTNDMANAVGIPRPVRKLPESSPKSADIDLGDFQFASWSMSRYGPSPWPIEGEPSKGVRYYTEARLYGTEAIATAKFEAIDESGVVIAPVPIRRVAGPSGDSEFYGLMVAPDRPFRILVRGQTIDGEQYERKSERLFKPLDHPVEAPVIAQLAKMKSPAEARKIRALLEEKMKKDWVELQEDINKRQDGVIVMPMTRVFNVMYQPLFSPTGRPRGIRITYDAEFSENGYYNPALGVFPAYENEEWRGRVSLNVLEGSIKPQPEERGSPQVQPHLLAYGAGYMYLSKTTYHFVAELVPDFAVRNEAKTKFCLYNQKTNYDPPHVRAAWEAVVLSKAPITYRVSIDNSGFYGVIENFHSIGTFYDTFVRDGARDCGPEPTSRF